MLDAKLHGSFKIIKVMLPTAVKLELPSLGRIHNSLHVSFIEHFHITCNVNRDPPDLNAMVTDEHELGYNVK